MNNPTETRKTLEGAREILDKKGIVGHSFESADGRCCTIGALHKAATGQCWVSPVGTAHITRQANRTRQSRAYELLGDVCGMDPERFTTQACMMLGEPQSVLVAFDKAILIAKKEELEALDTATRWSMPDKDKQVLDEKELALF